MELDRPATINSHNHLYDADYYASHLGTEPYVAGSPVWTAFYDRIADEIVRTLTPKRVFDAGCAIGFLVAALRDRNIECYGRDISEYAIPQVRSDVREFCSVGSIADPIEGQFDLILCIEVLEHMPEEEALKAIAQMAKASSQVLFSSTPNDFDEPTHINVRPIKYWIKAFCDAGLNPVFAYDASFLIPHAMLFRKENVALSTEAIDAFSELMSSRIRLASAKQEYGVLEQSLNDANFKIESLEGSSESLIEQVRYLSEKAQLAEDLDLQNSSLKSQVEELTLSWSKEVKNFSRSMRAWEDREERLRIELNSVQLENQGLQESLAWSNNRLLEVEQERIATERELVSIKGNLFWRLTAPARLIVRKLPKTVHRILRFAVRLAWRVLTLRLLSNKQPIPEPLQPASHAIHEVELLSDSHDHVNQLDAAVQISKHFSSLRPLNVFSTSIKRPTVSIITDSISGGSLFGGVGTSIVVGTLLAEKLGASLRVITRQQRGDAKSIALVQQLQELVWDDTIDILHSEEIDGISIPISTKDVFITTSWWTTESARRSIPSRQILYLLQEDERMFYPNGDSRLRCQELLSRKEIQCLINSNLLREHLLDGPERIDGLDARSRAFEPAFPDSLFFPDFKLHREGEKRNFFFYARPNNVRNLYWRGLETLQLSLIDGILDPNEWRFIFAGKDIQQVELHGNPEIQLVENLSLDEYASLIRKCDMGLSLMDTPHPSYPPLDLAASGAVVITNRFGNKTTLDAYCRNILCASATTQDLLVALRQGVELVNDKQLRLSNFENAGIPRDWRKTLEEPLSEVVGLFD